MKRTPEELEQLDDWLYEIVWDLAKRDEPGPTRDALAKMMGVSKGSIQRCLYRMEDQGTMRFECENGKGRYVFADGASTDWHNSRQGTHAGPINANALTRKLTEIYDVDRVYVDYPGLS